MKPAYRAMATAPLAVAFVVSASAQNAAHPYYFRIGGSYVTNSDTRDQVNSTGFSGALGYDMQLPAQPGMGNVKWGLELNFNYNKGNDGKLQSYDLSFVGRFMGKNPQEPYFGLGLGFGNTKLEGTTTVSNGSGGTTTTAWDDNKSGITAKALVGMNVSKEAFLELAYCFGPSVNGFKTDTIRLEIGVRF